MRKIMSIFLVGLIAINILYVFTGVLFHPMQSTDAIGIWLLKAKAFYVYGGFPLDFLRNSNYNYSHQQYPLGIPFIFYLFYLFIGGINEKIILLIYPFTYVAILFVAYKVLKSITDDFKALIFTYFYSMFSPLIAQGGRILAGGADIFITLIGWLIAYFILVSKSKNKYFIITALIIVASQIKAEAFFLSIILLFMPLKAKKKISFFIISLIPFLIWRYLIFLLKIPSNDAFYWRSLPVLISRFFEIIQGVFREFINYKNWYMFWPLFFLSIFIKTKINKKISQIIVPIFLASFGFIIVVFLFINTNPQEHIPSSLDRLLLQISPWFYLFFVAKITGKKPNLA